MTQQGGLSQYNIIGFVTIVDVERAKRFYQATVGLRLVGEVPNIKSVVNSLGAAGVHFERYRFLSRMILGSGPRPPAL